MGKIEGQQVFDDSLIKAPLEMSINVDKLVKKFDQLIGVLKKTESSIGKASSTSKIKEENQKLITSEKELVKVSKQVETARSKQNEKYIKQQQELIKLRTEQKRLVDESGRELGTIEKLTKRNKELTDQRKRLNLETAKGRKQLASINKELDKNNKRLKGSNDALGKQKMNIGNYQSALQGLPGPLGGAARATQFLTKASLAFIATPIGAVIAALGLAIGALTSFFKGSEEGQNSFTKVTKAAMVVWGNFKDIIIDVGKGIFKLVNLDFKGAKEAFTDAAKGVQSFVAESKYEIEIQNKLSDLRAKNIVLLRESRLFEAKSLTKIARLREEAAKIEEIDAAKAATFIREAIKLNDEIASKKEEVLQNDLRIQREEAKLSESTTETLNAVNDAEIALENARNQRATANIRRLKELNTLEKKAATQAKNNVDVTAKALTDIEALSPDTDTKLDIYAPKTSDLEKRLDANVEAYKANQEKINEIDKQAKEDRLKLIGESASLAGEVFEGFSDLRIQQISDELNALEFARNRELEVAGESEAAKFEINKRFDKQRKDLQKKQANAEKQNALFQIALNTAIGITNALSKVATIPLIPFIAASGLVQAGIVLAKPLPQFDKGTESTPKDYIAGEKRPEFRVSKGKLSLVDRPTLFKNSPGDKIISGKETDSILGTIQDITGANILANPSNILSLLNNDNEKKTDELAFVMKKGFSELNNTMKRKKSNAHIGIYGKSRDEIDRIKKMYQR